MSEHFRLVVPEIITLPSESIPDHTTQHKVNTILWRGEDYPGQAVIDSAIEGQVYNAREQLEHPPDSLRGTQRVGNHLLVQQRRARIKLLGWKTIDLINIPDSLE